MSSATINFLRTVRTVSSESWVMNDSKGVLGFVHLHMSSSIHGDIILVKKVSEERLQFVLNEIENNLVASVVPREDFIFSVYQAKELGFYSDIVDHEDYAPTKRDFNEHKKLISNVLSKYQDVRGQLNEHVVKEYLSRLGYNAFKADSIYDALKIDVIAENEDSIIYCQVKLGKISAKTIFSTVDSIVSVCVRVEKKVVVAIVANSFPIDVESIREDLETKFNVRIWFVFKNQILSELPEYKRNLKN